MECWIVMLDTLNVVFEEFPVEGIKVLTISRGDEAINMWTDYVAETMFRILLGENEITVSEEDDTE